MTATNPPLPTSLDPNSLDPDSLDPDSLDPDSKTLTHWGSNM